ncbi:hypothetical protein ACTXT7_013746, partial [Hymenolepis weldensis]
MKILALIFRVLANITRRRRVLAFLLCLVWAISFFLTVSVQRRPSRWPLKFQKRHGLYEIALEYTIGAGETQRIRIPESAVIPNGRPHVFLNQEELEKISDDEWVRPINPIVYRGYPQAIDLKDTVSRVMAHRPIIEATFERRQLFRKTYGSWVNANAGRFTGLRIGLVFSMGMPRARADRTFFRGSQEFKLWGRSGDGLEPKALKNTRYLLAKEASEYGDLVIGAFEDTYFNLTMKTHYSFMWASTFCRESRPDFLFIDEDIPFSPQALDLMISSMPKFHRMNLFHGKVETKNIPIRFGSQNDQRWAVLKSEVPFPLYAPYLQGIYILAGFSQVERIALGMMFTKYFPIEDAWLGLVANRLDITARNIHEFIEREDMLIEDRSAFEPWFHRNPFKASGIPNFDLGPVAADIPSRMYLNYMQERRATLIRCLSDLTCTRASVVEAANQYIALLLGFATSPDSKDVMADEIDSDYDEKSGDEIPEPGASDATAKTKKEEKEFKKKEKEAKKAQKAEAAAANQKKFQSLRRLVEYTWTDSLDIKHKFPISLRDANYELIGICFNLALWFSKHAAKVASSSNIETEQAVDVHKSLRNAAGLFEYIKKNLLPNMSGKFEKGSDLDPIVLESYILQSLAEAQEVAIARAIELKHDPGIIAALASETATLYEKCKFGLQNMPEALVSKWRAYCIFKTACFRAYMIQ